MEAKYRGKVLYNGNHYFSGDWVEGFYYENRKGEAFIIDTEPDDLGNVSFDHVQVDHETTCRSTTLEDWWENDIGEHPVSRERFVAKWNENRGQWCAVYNGDEWHALYMQIGDRGLAVKVGTIHD